MKTIPRALVLLFGPIIFGAFIIPFVLWALDSFPDGGSHGLWFPVIFGMYLGLPAGIAVGLVSVVIYLFRLRLVNQKDDRLAAEPETLVPTGPFDKY